MARVTYIRHDGARSELEIDSGWSVMEGAVKNGVPNIDADCGGACACATCHVFVDPAWMARLTEPTAQEIEMLECVESRQGNSRLSCQIKVGDALDGLVVSIPEHQH